MATRLNIFYALLPSCTLILTLTQVGCVFDDDRSVELVQKSHAVPLLDENITTYPRLGVLNVAVANLSTDSNAASGPGVYQNILVSHVKSLCNISDNFDLVDRDITDIIRAEWNLRWEQSDDPDILEGFRYTEADYIIVPKVTSINEDIDSVEDQLKWSLLISAEHKESTVQGISEVTLLIINVRSGEVAAFASGAGLIRTSSGSSGFNIGFGGTSHGYRDKIPVTDSIKSAGTYAFQQMLKDLNEQANSR